VTVTIKRMQVNSHTPHRKDMPSKAAPPQEAAPLKEAMPPGEATSPAEIMPPQPTGFEATFFQHYARVYAVLFRLVGSRAEAEDLALETFCKLWQQPPAHAENVGGWLYRVATRMGYNALRAAKRRMHYEGMVLPDNSNSDGLDPARAAERAEERAGVRAVLGRMSERDAQLLILRHSGLSYQEIAAAIDVAPSSVGTLLTRAEEEFEKLYEKGGSDAPRR
jgi:RNA polymerase sigma-70 factor (ECF subfamily)